MIATQSKKKAQIILSKHTERTQTWRDNQREGWRRHTPHYVTHTRHSEQWMQGGVQAGTGWLEHAVMGGGDGGLLGLEDVERGPGGRWMELEDVWRGTWGRHDGRRGRRWLGG